MPSLGEGRRGRSPPVGRACPLRRVRLDHTRPSGLRHRLSDRHLYVAPRAAFLSRGAWRARRLTRSASSRSHAACWASVRHDDSKSSSSTRPNSFELETSKEAKRPRDSLRRGLCWRRVACRAWRSADPSSFPGIQPKRRVRRQRSRTRKDYSRHCSGHPRKRAVNILRGPQGDLGRRRQQGSDGRIDSPAAHYRGLGGHRLPRGQWRKL